MVFQTVFGRGQLPPPLSRTPMVSKAANKQLGVLKRTCPSLIEIKVRRTLYLSQVWSPVQNKLLKYKKNRDSSKESDQMDTENKTSEMWYKQRLSWHWTYYPFATIEKLKTLLCFLQHELHLWIDYTSKFLNTSEFIIMINWRHILNLSW
jgi:hypothetical protein